MGKEKQQYRIFAHIHDVDISEQDILEYDKEVLNKLLIDHTMSAKARREAKDPNKVVNIFWATSDYEATKSTDEEKTGYRYHDQITPDAITGTNGRVIMPRVLKDKQQQLDRTKDKAEVFTPSWVCNAQNNLVDDAWFGPDHEHAFNTEMVQDGVHTWDPTDQVKFPEDDKLKTWKKYVTDNRMEITCGEAPYLVSRYDTTTGEPIPIERRIGLLDRKLRVISENTDTPAVWLEMARKAFQHTYGYEWQGDNLLLAREALLFTFIEYYIAKFNKPEDYDENGNPKNVPQKSSIIGIAYIISWNLWQMDGIKMEVPNSDYDEVDQTDEIQMSLDLFGDADAETDKSSKSASGRKSAPRVVRHHPGVPCLIRDWNKKKPANWQSGADEKGNEKEKEESRPWQKIKFSTLLYNNSNSQDDEEE